ncbi:MAG: Demethyldecarbamoylnovobiocin O-methyltransferase [Cyanobacteriota bacterium]|jgi:asparagine synthase (glutamine-hydrolysing)
MSLGLSSKSILGRIKRYAGKIEQSWKRSVISTNLSEQDLKLIADIRAQKITYLSETRLASINSTCSSIEDANLAGLFIEAGCALGGSAILIASTKRMERPFLIYDVFGMIPAPTEEDPQDVHERYQTIVMGKSTGIGGEQYYGYLDNLYDVVQFNLTRFGINCQKELVSLIKGLVQDTMVIDQPVAFAHIDVDWYEPVLTSLKRIFPNLVVGGSIILDDYHDWGGCRKATDEFLREVTGQLCLR